MRPLKFKPVYIGTIWGSEDWILSAMEGRQTVCVEGLEAEASVVPENFGEGAGLSLSALVEKYGARLVGDNVWNMYGNRFPLLIKYINSNQQLSVQVQELFRILLDQRGDRVARHSDDFHAAPAEKREDLTCQMQDLGLAAVAIRLIFPFAEIDDVLAREQLLQLPDDGESAQSRVHHPDRSVCVQHKDSLPS